MDEVYAHLSAFRAEGGGDGPEHVSAAMHDAVHRLTWSSGNSLRMIFLVGDAPPHVDYQDGFDYRRHVGEARQRGIVVEAIQCGGDTQTAQVWREIASTGGRPLRADRRPGRHAGARHRRDAELARLNAAGGDGGRGRQRGRAARHGDEAGGAQGHARARGRGGGGLLRAPGPHGGAGPRGPARGGAEEGAALRAAGLAGQDGGPGPRVPPAQKIRRAALQSRIRELGKQRERSWPRARPEAFDEKVVGALKEQAKKQGIAY